MAELMPYAKNIAKIPFKAAYHLVAAPAISALPNKISHKIFDAIPDFIDDRVAADAANAGTFGRFWYETAATVAYMTNVLFTGDGDPSFLEMVAGGALLVEMGSTVYVSDNRNTHPKLQEIWRGSGGIGEVVLYAGLNLKDLFFYKTPEEKHKKAISQNR